MRFGALVVEEPGERDQTAKITVRAKKYFRAGEKMPIDTKILLTVSRYPEYNYGGEVTVSGRITKPKAFADENTGRTFDYPSYLSAKGIYYEMFRPSVSLAAEGRGNPRPLRALFSQKNFIQNISERIQEPESSLLSGLVVGAKQSLGSDLLDQFRRVGIIHIVVLSGYNITIIADSILKFFIFLASFFGGSGINKHCSLCHYGRRQRHRGESYHHGSSCHFGPSDWKGLRCYHRPFSCRIFDVASESEDFGF